MPDFAPQKNNVNPVSQAKSDPKTASVNQGSPSQALENNRNDSQVNSALSAMTSNAEISAEDVQFMGGVLSFSGNPTTGEGEFEYEHTFFHISGKRSPKDNPSDGFEYEGKGQVLSSSVEASSSLPIFVLPLGVPGLFATVTISAEASASVAGNVGMRFETDVSNVVKPGSVDFVGASIEATIGAKCGVQGGVTAGVPGIASATLGGYGELGAEITGTIELANYDDENSVSGTWAMTATLEGEAKGSAGLVAQAEVLIFKAVKKIPLAEGSFGKFERKVEKAPLSLAGLKEIASIAAYSFKPTLSEAQQEEKNKEQIKKEKDENIVDEPKKKSLYRRILGK